MGFSLDNTLLVFLTMAETSTCDLINCFDLMWTVLEIQWALNAKNQEYNNNNNNLKDVLLLQAGAGVIKYYFDMTGWTLKTNDLSIILMYSFM